MLRAHLRVLYLHGFASSPASRKARFFAERLGSIAVPIEIPDLAEGRFHDLTITGQLKLIEKTVREEPVILIGSSLGGYLAALYAAKHAHVNRLVLLAPAFGFHDLWTRELGPERLRAWRENATISVYHYGEQRHIPIRYELMEDAARYPAFPDFRQPALIFHGIQDPVVPVQYSSAFVQKHENARLIELESGHELTDVLDDIWMQAQHFLVDPRPQIQC